MDGETQATQQTMQQQVLWAVSKNWETHLLMYSHGCCNLKSASGVVAAQSQPLLLHNVQRDVWCTKEEMHCVAVTAKLCYSSQGEVVRLDDNHGSK